MSEEQKLNNEPVESTEPGNNDETGKRIHLSHDGLFRRFFDKKNVAESFIKENLPAEITKDLDFSALTPSKDTFVGKKLARCYSDVLYYARFKGAPAYLYFLFEHKSWEPNFPGVQLLKNMAHIWEAHIEKHIQMFREFSDKTKFNETLESLLIYLWSNIKDYNFDQLQESVNEAFEEGGAIMGTILQEILDRGKEIGIKEGEERGERRGESRGEKRGERKGKVETAKRMLIDGVTIENIVKYTGLKEKDIEKLAETVH